MRHNFFQFSIIQKETVDYFKQNFNLDWIKRFDHSYSHSNYFQDMDQILGHLNLLSTVIMSKPLTFILNDILFSLTFILTPNRNYVTSSSLKN